MHPALQGLITIFLGVGGCVGYFYYSNYFLDTFMYPARKISRSKLLTHTAMAPAIMLLSILSVIVLVAILLAFLVSFSEFGVISALINSFVYVYQGIFTLQWGYWPWIVAAAPAFSVLFILVVLPASEIGRNITRANMVRPWLFVLPAVLALGLYLAYPVVETLRLSLTERVTLPDGSTQFNWVGLDNYRQMMGEPKFWEALLNNGMWLLIVPAFSTAFGLLAAQLTDRIGWGNIAKSLIFMPMAISFVGAAVIFKLVYDTRPIDQDQIGILNALYLWLGGEEPKTWLTIPIWNNMFLMVVLIWIQTGFAMVILSAALRGIPEETIEAAIVDGAGPFQVFFKIKVPQIMGTIVVVWTTITIVVLKVFDIVFAMTNGQWQTQVLANYMFDKLFRANDWGVGSASAMVIMLLVTPILVWNVRNARKEMQ